MFPRGMGFYERMLLVSLISLLLCFMLLLFLASDLIWGNSLQDSSRKQRAALPELMRI